MASLGDLCLSSLPPFPLLFESTIKSYFHVLSSLFQHLLPPLLCIKNTLYSLLQTFSFSPPSSYVPCSVSCSILPSHSLSLIVCLSLSLHLSCIHIAMETGSCSSLQLSFFSLTILLKKEKDSLSSSSPLQFSRSLVLVSLPCCQGEASAS